MPASLYRLDINYPDGRVVPVRQPVIGGAYLAYDRNTARAHAKTVAAILAAASDDAQSIVCTRIYGAGSMRRSFTVNI